MAIRVGINGFGRIGRQVLRATKLQDVPKDRYALQFAEIELKGQP